MAGLELQTIAKHGVTWQDICSEDATFYIGWLVIYVHQFVYFVLPI